MDVSMDGISPASSHASKPSPDGPPPTGTSDGQRPAKKPRKRATATDKKHVCPEPGCEKSFSRPDHLSRHRLNHNPTTTYRCTYTPCSKTFVRLDLLVRHEERHLRKVDPEKAAEHRARTAKAQAQAVQHAQQNAQAQAQAASGSAQGGSEGGSPFRMNGSNLPTLAGGPLPGGPEFSNDPHQPFPPRMYGLASNTGFSPSSFSSGASGSGQPFTAFSPDQYGPPGHQQPLRQNSAPDIYHHQQHQQFRPDASTSGSATSGIPPNGGPTVASPDIFNALSQHASPHATQPRHQLPLPPPQPQHDPFQTFDPTPPPPSGFGHISALDLVQASYGAPFVSASEYDWLFDPAGGLDISFPASRPASPFGSGAGSMVGSAVGGQPGGAGWMDFGMGYGGGAGAGGPGGGAGPSFGEMGGANGAGGLGSLGGIGGIGGPGRSNGGAVSPDRVRQQLEAFGQQQQEQAQGAGFESMGDWGTIVEEPQQIPQDDPGTAPEDSASAAGEKQDPAALDGDGAKEMELEPPIIQPAPPTPAATLTDNDKSKAPATNGSTSSKPPGVPEKSATNEAQTAEESSAASADSGAQTAATSVRTPFNQAQDPTIFIDNDTRMRVIDYCGPSWQNLRGDTRMTRGAMMEYMELFWTRVHETQAPAVHRASFKASTAPTPLLLSMLLLGCYFSSPEAYKLAMNLHAGFRGKVLCSNDFRPRAELWLHQTILLIVIFGKLCSTRMDHEMSHIFWSSCVTLGRRSAIFSQRQPAVFPPGHNDLETQWAAWIEEEVAKRIALIVFGVDVEHAAFFRHSPTLSAFQIQLQLPCDEELWEARDAQEWARLRVNARPPIPFISALKASLMAGHAPPALNPFSRIAILHGLLSVAQDLQWRDHVIGMSQPEGRANNWRDMISGSYNSWKSRLDACLVTATFPTSQLLRASISLYAVAHITLSIDIHELQIYAGAESALGLVVSAAIYNATEARIKIWSSTKDARAACWHAAFFLRSSLQHYQQQGVDLAGCLHHRWSVFIATLTLYAYGRSTSGLPGPRSENYREAAMRYLDSMCTNSPEGLLAVPGKNNTLDLCQTICEYVESSRWEIAQEGAKILRILQHKSPSAPNH